MNTRKLNIFVALLGLVLAFASCQPDEFSLGKIISKDDLQYSITQNADDPNMIILESLTPEMTPLWVTPAGRSTELKDTVKIAFPGEYKFVYGVESAGGFVQADTMVISITTTNLSYVDDPLWNMLTGGVGESKTWILDNGKYGLTNGPMYFADPSREQVWGNYEINWDPSGSSVGATDQDYAAEMTFDLIGGPHLTSYKPNEGDVTEQGVFDLNVKNHTLSTTDATIIRLAAIAPNAKNWNTNVKVLDLTENQLRVAIYRDNNDEQEWWYVFNYVSKDYADNYQYADPEPELPDGWQDIISKTVSTTIVWKLSESNPLDWANLDGSMMNGWQAPEDYPDWLGTPDPSVYGSFSMTMNSNDQSVVFVTPDGTTTNGTYSLDDKGIYSFDVTVPSFTLINWASFAPDANNHLRILQIKKDLSGNVTDMWVGARDASAPQYTAFHLVAQTGGGSDNGPQGTEIAFDNSKLVIGDPEDKGNLRLELYNEYGLTKADPGINTADLVFSNRIDVTFTISGITLKDDAVGNYDASMYYADADWTPNANGDVIQVNGDGTYTVSYSPESDAEGAVVFVIDILGMGADITDLSAVTATIDKVVTY